MRYKVGAEQLQQVPTLLHRPDSPFRASRVAPAGPTHAVSTRTGEAACGIRADGLEVLDQDWEQPSSSRNVRVVSRPPWPMPATSRIACAATHNLLAPTLRRSHHRDRDSAGIMTRSEGRMIRRPPISPGRQSLTHSGVLHDLEGSTPSTTLPIFSPVSSRKAPRRALDPHR